MLGLHLIAVLAIAAMVAAGIWQLDAYSAQLEDEAAERATAPATPLAEVMGPDDAFPPDAAGTPVVVRGRYAEADQQFLVAGRQEAGRDGYWVLSPLLVEGVTAAGGQPSALLVVRGWQPDPVLPSVLGGPVTVTGLLQPGDLEGTGVGADRVVTSVRLPSLVAEVPYDLYSGYALRTGQDPPPKDGLVTVTPPTPDTSWTTGLRSLAYALQWWVFAAFAGFMWWHICREQVVRATAGDRPRAPASVG